jgi:hypothetical protein
MTKEIFLNLALADSRLFWRVIESQGYDLWLTKSDLKSTKHTVKATQNINLLCSLKRLIEFDIFIESKLVTSFHPYRMRLPSILDLGDDNEPIGYYNDDNLAPELTRNL